MSNVEKQLEEISEELEAVETDTLKKEFKDLTDDEKKKIIIALKRYKESDSFTSLIASLEEEAQAIEDKVNLEKKGRKDKELVYSPFDRETRTSEYMQEIAEKVDNSDGGSVFKKKLIDGANQYYKSTMDKIEPLFDSPCYTELDFLRNERLLRKSVKVWLEQTINSYEKVQEAEDIKGAY